MFNIFWIAYVMTNPIYNRPVVDPALLPFVSEFVYWCNKFDLKDRCEANFAKIQEVRFMRKDELDYKTYGFCSKDMYDRRAVVVSRIYDSLEQKETVFHEMGHCVLGKGNELLPHTTWGIMHSKKYAICHECNMEEKNEELNFTINEMFEWVKEGAPGRR